MARTHHKQLPRKRVCRSPYTYRQLCGISKQEQRRAAHNYGRHMSLLGLSTVICVQASSSPEVITATCR